MSFGFSVGDFIAAGKLAFDLVEACRRASEDYKELADLCRAVSVAVEACRPNDPFTVLRRQNVETISILAADCTSTLRRLQDLLESFQNLNTVRNIGRKIGFVTAKQERSDIRVRLQEHLSAINTFLNGVQMETLGLTVRLVLKMVEGRSEGHGHANLHELIEDPEKLEALLNDFSSESKTTRDELQKNQEALKRRLKEAMDPDVNGQASTSKLTGSTAESSHARPSHRTLAGFASPSIASYNPLQIDWFAAGAWKWLQPVSVDASCFMKWNLPSLQIRYSKQDEYLCVMPEGWSMTPTLVERDSKMEEAYFYVFNNLSCASNNVPRTSRAYCVINPFLSNADKTASSVVTFNNLQTVSRKPTTRFYEASTTDALRPLYTDYVFARSQNPSNYVDCAGFLYKDFWLDLKDDLSQELARIEAGHDGKRQIYSEDMLCRDLPENWILDPDINGPGRHVYIDTDTGIESTVHPARFYDPTSKDPSSLPPGWDRRLDTHGNLFFIDHNTMSAVREDPRFNANIDSATGMPKGWKSVKDHKGKAFFYRVHGKMILGTYIPQTMNERSVQGKKILKAEPKDGDDPRNYDLNARPRDRDRIQKRRESSEIQEKHKIREMTEEEKRQYYKLFSFAPKQNELFMSFEEAMAHCQAFDILPGIAAQILLASDTNQDRQFDCDEYATALHQIRVTMERTYSSSQIPAATPQEKEVYYSVFQHAKKPDELVMKLSEVIELCRSYDLPELLVEKVWEKADANHDQNINPTEFADGMHQIFKEHERREAIRMNGKLPVTEPHAAHTGSPTSSDPTTSNRSALDHVQTGLNSLSVSYPRQNVDGALGIEHDPEVDGEGSTDKSDSNSANTGVVSVNSAEEPPSASKDGTK